MVNSASDPHAAPNTYLQSLTINRAVYDSSWLTRKLGKYSIEVTLRALPRA
jgi:hypothetical protein